MADDEHEREERQREEIQADVGAQEGRPVPGSARRGDVGAREQEDVREFLERECGDRDLEPADAQRRQPGDRRGRRRGRDCDEHGHRPRCTAAAHVDRGEGTHTEERGVGERQLTGARDEDVEPERRDRGHDHPDEDRQLDVAQEERPADRGGHDDHSRRA